MSTTADYLNKLISQKKSIVDILNNNGIIASYEETLETLIPKISNIKTVITPSSLGYIADSSLMKFFDGEYTNNTNKIENPLIWLNLADNGSTNLIRDKGSIGNNYFFKDETQDSIFLLKEPFDYDNFTIEIIFEILSASSSSECDIFSNYNSAGLGMSTYNSTDMYFEMHGSSDYVQVVKTTYTLNKKYYVQAVYNGQWIKVYIDGSLAGEQELLLSGYKKSTSPLGLGGAGAKKYYTGTYNFYRFAIYNRALTTDELMNNYNIDIVRYS